MDTHYRHLHSGEGSTVATLSQSYWIPSIKQTVKTLLDRYVVHRKVMGTHYRSTIPTRFRQEPPFFVIGVDLTGALKMRSWDNREVNA